MVSDKIILKAFRLFSHDGKVRILNFNSNCAFWVTQYTHDRSTCVFWITQYTHERPKLWFAFRERGEVAWLCLGSLPIKHACGSEARRAWKKRALWMCAGDLASPVWPACNFQNTSLQYSLDIRPNKIFLHYFTPVDENGRALALLPKIRCG